MYFGVVELFYIPLTQHHYKIILSTQKVNISRIMSLHDKAPIAYI